VKSSYRKWIPVLLVFGLMVPVARGKTKLVQSWVDPSAGNYQFKKLIAIAVITNPDIRSTTERAMVRNIRRFKAIPSYTVLVEGDERDTERLKGKLRDGGFDGAVVLRLVSVGDKVAYTAPNMPDPYINLYTYNTYWMATNASRPEMRYEQILQLELLVFSLTDDKRLYSSVSEAKNPKSPSQLVDDISKIVGDELRKKGLVK
jgi:hypothetical protein